MIFIFSSKRCYNKKKVRVKICTFAFEMRLNKQIVALADTCAQENGYFCASYLGRKGDEFIFGTRYDDSEPRCEGLPALVVVWNGVARFLMDVESFSYLNGLKFRACSKGKRIYHEWERKYDNDDFVNDEERKYISAIVQNQRPGYDIPIPKEDLFDYIEIADRFGMKLEIKPSSWCKERNDGWEYYLKLRKFKKHVRN